MGAFDECIVKGTQITVVDQSTAAGLNSTIGAGMKVGISSFAAWMLGVGAIIGSMAWLFEGPMIARAGTLASITAWILAGLFTVPLALILMELASMFPTAGGPYVYKYYALKRLLPGMGELLGFLTGWLFWMCMLGGLACVSNGLANPLSTSLWGSVNTSPLWFSPLIIFALFASTTALNLLQVGSAARLNNLFTLMKFAMAISFGALVLCSPDTSVSHLTEIANPAGGTDFFKNVSSLLMLALAGYAGVEMTGCMSSETANAKKAVPKAMFLTLATVMLMYVGMCAAVSIAAPYVLNAGKTTVVIAGTNVQATCPAIAGYLGGNIWGTAFTACVVASIVGCGFGCLLATARFGYSMAKTGLFPAQFAVLDPISKVPKYALMFQFWCLCFIGIGANPLARSGVFPDAYTFLAET